MTSDEEEDKSKNRQIARKKFVNDLKFSDNCDLTTNNNSEAKKQLALYLEARLKQNELIEPLKQHQKEILSRSRSNSSRAANNINTNQQQQKEQEDLIDDNNLSPNPIVARRSKSVVKENRKLLDELSADDQNNLGVNNSNKSRDNKLSFSSSNLSNIVASSSSNSNLVPSASKSNTIRAPPPSPLVSSGNKIRKNLSGENQPSPSSTSTTITTTTNHQKRTKQLTHQNEIDSNSINSSQSKNR